MLDLCLADNRDLYFWKVLEFIQNFIIDLHVLQCLFASGSNKKQRRGRIISNFTKEQTFWSLMTTKCSWGKEVEWVNLKILSPSLHHTKMPSSPLQFGQEKNIPGNSIERRGYWFVLKIARMLPILTSRNRMVSTL